tara:strand:- start:1070 stop:1324 length:255 start_codon:yes stop_codon:yes gene_type:complete
MSENESFVPIEVIAKHFSVSIATIRSWYRKKEIPEESYIKVGNTYRFKISAVENALTGDSPISLAGEQYEDDLMLAGINIDDDV